MYVDDTDTRAQVATFESISDLLGEVERKLKVLDRSQIELEVLEAIDAVKDAVDTLYDAAERQQCLLD